MNYARTDTIKDLYNKEIQDRFGHNYEYGRWFSAPILKSGYEMTEFAINQWITKDLHFNFNHCIELGSGAGTWTKLLLNKYPNANYDLIDISVEMLRHAKKALSKYPNVEYFEIDFLQYETLRRYDFFFSSRAIEYISDKKSLVNKIWELMDRNSRGFLITKTPKYYLNKIFGRKISSLHTGQISPRALKILLRDAGFQEIVFYPVTISFPFFKSSVLNKILHFIFRRWKLNPASEFFSESYCVKFKKQ